MKGWVGQNAEVRWSTLAEAEKLLGPTGGVWEPIREYLDEAFGTTPPPGQSEAIVRP